MTPFPPLLLAISLTLAAPLSLADDHTDDTQTDALGAGVAVAKGDGVRVMTAVVEAEITGIDLETREVTLLGPQGRHVTVHAREELAKLEDLAIGDRVVVEYMASLEGELRVPTEEELANPWVVITDRAKSSNTANPAAGAARQIRAVCTIEAADRSLGYVVVKDARGKMHTITGVEPEKFEGVSLGDQVVMVYTEALAVAIEHKSKTGM